MTKNHSYCVVFITTQNRDEASGIAHTLLDMRLAACATLINDVTSIFWWKGKKDASQESLLIVKTKVALFEALEKAVKGMHSYQVPELIALPIIMGNQDYLDWINEETNALLKKNS